MDSAERNDVPTDGDLARRVSGAGSRRADEAEAELYRRLYPRARLYGLRHLRDSQAAADLAQEALWIALQRLRSGEIRDPEKITSFVLGTCRTLVREGRRLTGRREQLLEEYGRTLPMVDTLEDRELDRDRLQECLERLGERERSVVVMTFYAERTGDEVARDLGLSPQNVRVIRHRTLARLRACMTEGRDTR